MSDLDKWLNEGLSESVAKAEAELTPVPAAPPSPPAVSPKGPRTLSSMGITKGGVIRNPNTKRRSQTSNPVTNPRPPSKTVKAPTQEEDLRAENPALAFPSLMTGMDVDAMKSSNGAVEQPPPPPQAPAPAAAPPLTYQSTVAQLLERAIKNGGTYHFSNEHVPSATSTFVISIEVRPRASRAPA
jgi:hypothetical protein